MATTMEVIASAVEIECIKKLAKRFENGQFSLQLPTDYETIGLTSENGPQVVKTLEAWGIIKRTYASPPFAGYTLSVTQMAVQAARQKERQDKEKSERKDIVESVKFTLRQHPILGWCVVGFMGLTAIFTALNQILSVLKTTGVIGSP